jgi:hypothetical protein
MRRPAAKIRPRQIVRKEDAKTQQDRIYRQSLRRRNHKNSGAVQFATTEFFSVGLASSNTIPRGDELTARGLKATSDALRKEIVCFLQFCYRRPQLDSAFANSLLKGCALIIEEQMRVTAPEKIANAQSDFDVIEWLEQEISRAGFERAPFRFLVGVGSEHYYWQKYLAGIGPKQFEKSEPIRRRHHEVEQDEIRLEIFANLQCALGINDRLESSVLIFNQNFFEQ